MSCASADTAVLARPLERSGTYCTVHSLTHTMSCASADTAVLARPLERGGTYYTVLLACTVIDSLQSDGHTLRAPC